MTSDPVARRRRGTAFATSPRRVRFARLLGVAALVLASAGQQQALAEPSSKTDDLATLVNRARVDHGIGPLARSTQLDSAAQAHSQDMVDKDYLDHTGSDGSDPHERAERAGYHVPPQSGWIVVEVISAISDKPERPLDWWLNQSPDLHGKVLMDPRWREMGVGYAAGGEYGNYWTVLLGCRPGVLPSVTLDGKTFEQTERCGDPASVTPSLTIATTAVQAGGDLEVRWDSIAAPNARDWLGLYRPADADGAYVAWTYVSCARMALTPRGSGWCWLRMSPELAGGVYEFRLYSDDGYERLATSPALSVTRP